jgi:anti-anti-sigma regulatory factor
METRLLEPDVLYVFLPPEPMLRPELTLFREHLPQVGDKHLILDLSRVEIITSPSIGNLLLLQRQQAQRERRLILCGARLATRCIFRVAGLDAHLDFAEDKSEALTAVHRPAVETH